MNQRSRYIDPPRRPSRALPLLCLGVLLAVQVLLLFYFAAERQGYHVDELFTYFLSNNSAPNAPYPKNEPDYLAAWHTADYFRSFLTCDPSEQFQFGFVYMNQRLDVLGPLYFALFHLVCSFVPGTFSIYPIVATHAALFVLSGILLWQMGRRLLHSDWAALLPVALWGFSAGAVSAGLYLRVYALLLFFLVLITFLAFRVAEHALYGEGPCISKRYVAAIAFATAGGLLTHYYFVLYTLFLGLTLGAYLLCQHRKQDLRRALCGVFLGVGGGILIFPASIMQAFTSYRGARRLGAGCAGRPELGGHAGRLSGRAPARALRPAGRGGPLFRGARRHSGAFAGPDGPPACGGGFSKARPRNGLPRL